MNPKHKQNNDPIICLCNHVKQSEIESAIKSGADTLNKIFDQTTAGVGPCGGSCRRILKPFLEHYLTTGEFLEKLPQRGKR